MIMKMRLKMKNRSHRYDINRPRAGHEHNMLNTTPKQHLKLNSLKR